MHLSSAAQLPAGGALDDGRAQSPEGMLPPGDAASVIHRSGSSSRSPERFRGLALTSARGFSGGDATRSVSLRRAGGGGSGGGDGGDSSRRAPAERLLRRAVLHRPPPPPHLANHVPLVWARPTLPGALTAGVGGGADAAGDSPGSAAAPAVPFASYSRWSTVRLLKLLMLTPTEDMCRGLFLRSTPRNVTFPDPSIDNIPLAGAGGGSSGLGLSARDGAAAAAAAAAEASGQFSWISLRRAREIVHLLLAHPQDQREALLAVQALSVVGPPQAYAPAATAKWPPALLRLLHTTRRVDRDAFAALLVAVRERARLRSMAALVRDFEAVFAPGPGRGSGRGGAAGSGGGGTGNGLMDAEAFSDALRCIFPCTFTPAQLDALFVRGCQLEGRLLEARQQRDAAIAAAAGSGGADAGGDDAAIGSTTARGGHGKAGAGVSRAHSHKAGGFGGVGAGAGKPQPLASAWNAVMFAEHVTAVAENLLR
jgi:hypothetical protein